MRSIVSRVLAVVGAVAVIVTLSGLPGCVTVQYPKSAEPPPRADAAAK